MKTTVRVSKVLFSNKQDALMHTGGFKNGWAVTDMELTIQELTEKWLAGHSILPARMKRGQRSNDANWVSQQIFALDFDNENGDKERVSNDYYVTPTEALEMAQRSGLSPAFIYSSFSSTAEHLKFRMVFVLDEEVTSKSLHNEVLIKLYSAFMKGGYIIADTRCSDLSRIYYGGRELLYENYTSMNLLSRIKELRVSDELNVSKLRSKRNSEGQRMYDYIPVSLMHADIVRGTTSPALTAIIEGDLQELREILHKSVDITLIKINENTGNVHTIINRYQKVKQIPLQHILDVPLSTHFRCIMRGHEDINPSASIVQRTDGSYSYYCHVCYGAGNGQSLIDLVMEARRCSIHSALLFLEAALDISLQTVHQRQSLALCQAILYFTNSAEFRTGKWEPLYKYMNARKLLSHYRYYLEQAGALCDEFPILGDGKPTFYESVRTTVNNLQSSEIHYTGTDKNSIYKKRNALADLGLIGKCTNSDHDAFDKAKAYQVQRGSQHHTEFLYINALTEEVLDFATKQIARAKENGERAKYKTKASTLLSRGEEATDRIYAQDSGKTLTKYQEKFISYMMRTVERLIEKGWTTEEEIVQEIKRSSKYTGVKWKVGQFRPYIINGNQYLLKSVTKEMITRMNLPDEITPRKKIIVRVSKIEVVTKMFRMANMDHFFNQIS